MPGALLRVREYARRRGVSHVAVLKAIRDGRIAGAMVSSRGGKLIDADAADRLWDANTDQAQQRPPPPAALATQDPGADVPRDLFGEPIPVEEPDDSSDDEGPPPGSFAARRAEREHWQAETTKLRYLQLARELVAMGRVRDLFSRLSRSTRDAMLALPALVAGEFAAESSPAKIEARLRAEIERILDELARGLDE